VKKLGQPNQKESSKTSTDPFFPLKYKGYCLAMTPPDGDSVSLEDFVEFAKFQLCEARNILRKDVIWDAYSDEEVLIEYYAILMSKDENLRKKMELEIGGMDYAKDLDWFDRQIKTNKKEVDEIAKEEEFDFKPVGE